MRVKAAVGHDHVAAGRNGENHAHRQRGGVERVERLARWHPAIIANNDLLSAVRPILLAAANFANVRGFYPPITTGLRFLPREARRSSLTFCAVIRKIFRGGMQTALDPL